VIWKMCFKEVLNVKYSDYKGFSKKQNKLCMHVYVCVLSVRVWLTVAGDPSYWEGRDQRIEVQS
jgi:hypothetical protein